MLLWLLNIIVRVNLKFIYFLKLTIKKGIIFILIDLNLVIYSLMFLMFIILKEQTLYWSFIMTIINI